MMPEKKDLFSQLGNDFMKVLVNRLVPKPRTTRKGRPAKGKTLAEHLELGVTASKLALPGLEVKVLLEKGMITGEQAAMVMHYVAANQESISVPELYPTSPNWIVKKALQEFGVDTSQISVTWDEIMLIAAQGLQMYSAQLQQQQAMKNVTPEMRDFIGKLSSPGLFSIGGVKPAGK